MRGAAAMGADMWEFDVRITAEGKTVVLHDETVLRTSDFLYVFGRSAEPRVHKLSLPALRRLDFSALHRPQSEKGEQHKPLPARKAHRILTLERALDLSMECGVLANVEIKECGRKDTQKIAKDVLCCIRDRDLLEKVLVSSFNLPALRKLRNMEEGVRLGVLFEGVSQCAEKTWRDIKPISCHVPFAELDSPVFRKLKNQGYKILVYTVDEREKMLRCLNWGVHGIFTNFPDRLKKLY